MLTVPLSTQPVGCWLSVSVQTALLVSLSPSPEQAVYPNSEQVHRVSLPKFGCTSYKKMTGTPLGNLPRFTYNTSRKSSADTAVPDSFIGKLSNTEYDGRRTLGTQRYMGGAAAVTLGDHMEEGSREGLEGGLVGQSGGGQTCVTVCGC